MPEHDDLPPPPAPPPSPGALPPPPLAPPSDSTLLRLWSFRFLPGKDDSSPWENTRIEMKDLARRLLLIAVLGMRDGGVAEVAVETRTHLKLVHTTQAWLTPTGRPPSTAFSGIEALMAATLATKREPVQTIRLVSEVLGWKAPDPYAHTSSLATTDAAAHGFYRQVAAPPKGLLRRQAMALEPVPAAIETTRTAAEAAIDRWNRSVQDNRPLHDQLTTDIYMALAAVKEGNRNDD